MDMVGGYRLVRLLGSGRRADVYLGLPPDHREPGVAVKVFRPDTALESIAQEIEVLGRFSHPHLLRLDDVTSLHGGRPALVLARLQPRSLAAVLAARGVIEAGEAVTILAPIAAALDELHRSGIAHRRLRLGAVLLDDRGAPVVTGFGRAVIAIPLQRTDGGTTAAARDDDVRVLRDLADLRALARTVLESIPTDSGCRALIEWLDGLDGQGSGFDGPGSALRPHQFAGELAERVFTLGDPLPLEVSVTRPRTPSRLLAPHPPGRFEEIGSRSVRTAAAPEAPAAEAAAPGAAAPEAATRRAAAAAVATPRAAAPRSPAAASRTRASSARRTGAASLLDRVSDTVGLDREWGGYLQTGADAVRTALAPVRPRVWLSAAAALVLLVGALTIVPALDQEAEAGERGGSPVPSRPETSVTSSGSGTYPSSDEPAPPSAGGPVAVWDGADGAVVAGDDPAAAGGVLLRRRVHCIEELLEACLDLVDHAGSAALDADRLLLERRRQLLSSTPSASGGAEAERSLAERPLVLVEQLGDTAILEVTRPGPETAPASLLLVRSEAGWRIRDVIVG